MSVTVLCCFSDLQQSLRRISELEALANSLSESVKEKSIALTHQKKANKSVQSVIVCGHTDSFLECC